MTGNLIWLKNMAVCSPEVTGLRYTGIIEEGNNTLCLSDMTSEGVSLIKGCITAVSIPSEQQQLKQFVNFADSWCLNCKQNDRAEYWDLKQMEYSQFNLLFLAGFKQLTVPGVLKNLRVNGVPQHARNE